MGFEHDMTVATKAAWKAFGRRLADWVAEMVDDDVLVVGPADDGDAQQCSGWYLQLRAVGSDLVRIELEAAHLTHRRCEADLVAAMVVRALHEVDGVLHPVFLDAAGLERDPGIAEPEHEHAASDDPTFVVMPRSCDHLQQLVDDAMRPIFPDLYHDPEGDIPVVCGRSMMFVRVLADRPAVELYAELVIGPDDAERVLVELGLLNAAHPLWQFVQVDDLVVMRHEVVALPLSPFHLRLLVDRFTDDVDRLAVELAARVGGRLFLDPPRALETEDAGHAVDDAGDDPWGLVMTGLLELCHLGRPRAATVAGLFDHDRLEIIRQIVRIRTGAQTCDGHDEDLVLSALRRALRVVSDGETARPVPCRPRSVPASLLSDGDLGEESLDLGWSG